MKIGRQNLHDKISRYLSYFYLYSCKNQGFLFVFTQLMNHGTFEQVCKARQQTGWNSHLTGTPHVQDISITSISTLSIMCSGDDRKQGSRLQIGRPATFPVLSPDRLTISVRLLYNRWQHQPHTGSNLQRIQPITCYDVVQLCLTSNSIHYRSSWSVADLEGAKPALAASPFGRRNDVLTVLQISENGTV